MPKTTTRRTRKYVKKDGTKVRGYSQQRETWKKTAAAGSLTAASGLGALFLVLEVAFTAVSTIAVILLALLSVVAGRQTIYTMAPNRTNARPRSRSRSGPGSAARRRAYARRARGRARRRKARAWAQRRGTRLLMASARGAGRAWRRMRGRSR